MLKVGFLMPRSSVYPLIGHDFIDACKAYLKESALIDEVEIITANIGFGIDEADVYAKNEQLLLQDNADIVIAFIDGRSAEMLHPLFSATGKILMIVNMGAFYAYDTQPSSTVITHTFDIAFNSRLTGKQAATDGHSSAVFATSYYDAGYLQCFAMAKRYLKDGNSISNNFVSTFKKEEFSTEQLETFLNDNPMEETLLCLFSGDVSPLMYQSLAALQQKRNLNLYVSPMMLDEALKNELGNSFSIKNTKGYTAWNSQLENEFNIVFKENFKRYSGRTPGIFSLLGWECGTILQEIGKLFKQDIKGPDAVRQLMQVTINSPRGWLKFDESIQQTYSPSYLVSADENFDLSIKEKLEDTQEERKAFIYEKPEGAASGWRNTYLCS